MDMMSIRCAVAVTNANGEPDLFFCRVECTKEQYDDGLHYRAAERAAVEDGYVVRGWTCDERDPAWRHFAGSGTGSSARFTGVDACVEDADC